MGRIKRKINYMNIVKSMIIIISIFLISYVLNVISIGSSSEDYGQVIIQAGLDKYVNYAISDTNTGTLVQYNVRMGIQYAENQEFTPIRESVVDLKLNAIDNKYPYDVEVIPTSNKVTNGREKDLQTEYTYNPDNGVVEIKTSNMNDQGEPISNSKAEENDRDRYIIISYYDTYSPDKPVRELSPTISAQVNLYNEEETVISKEKRFKSEVTENIGELTSLKYQTQDIYNGYIKSNIINGTEYETEYNETEEITVSNKDLQQKLKLVENNTFVHSYIYNEEEKQTDLGNNQNLLYKSTKLAKQNIIQLLGEDFTIEILDNSENMISTINKDSQFDENGYITINYDNPIEGLIIKTSDIKNEGILNVYNTKVIKSTMKEANNIKIKTTTQLVGINEEKVKTEENEEKINQIETFSQNNENVIEIKDSETDVSLNIDNKEWTNEQQNDVTFNVYMNSSNNQKNLYTNPQIKIELPSQVKKVILSDSSIIYGNGLQLDNCYVETDQDGSLNIVANISGTQQRYIENSLDLITDLKISGTVILNENIDSVTENVKLNYSNQYSVDGNIETGSKDVEVQLKNYEEKASTVQNVNVLYDTAQQLEQYNGKILLEVAPVKGDTSLSNGNVVYEGEYIKFNVKVTNISDAPIDNIKLVANIADGTTYGELKADYNSYLGEYKYNFDDSIRNKEIEIGTIGAGESTNKYYEVRVNNLDEGLTEKEILSSIKAYVGQEEVSSYELTNTVQKAQVQVFLAAQMDNLRDRWNYNVFISGEEGKDVTLQVKLPKEFEPKHYVYNSMKFYFEDGQISDDNVVTLTIKIPIKDQSNTNVSDIGTISIQGIMDSSKIEEETENSQKELIAVATVTADDVSYKSNENRIMYGYESVSIKMESDTEGEEIRYNDEINYKITVTNTGRTNLNDEAYSTTSVHVTDYLPEGVVPVSMNYQDWEQDVIVKYQDGTEETVTYTKLQELINEGKEIESYTPTGNFYKKEAVTEDISNILYDQDGNKLPNVDLHFNIPYGESVTIEVKVIADMLYEKTKVENNANVTGDRIEAKVSNTITNTILPYNYIEPTDPDPENPDPENPDPENPDPENPDPENPDPENPDPENPDPENPDPENPDPENPDPENPDPENPDESYSISGVAWLDENEDGRRDASEQLLSSIKVMLLSLDSGNQVGESTTQSNGKYTFQNIKEGNYLVAFEYDTDKYSVTQYKKNGVSNDVNSDVSTKIIRIDGKELTVGLTDVLNLTASTSNIDMGLVENKICDLKLDKYIQKVVIKTNAGTREVDYNNASLAKVEIRAKEIEGATIAVTYKIVVTNEGEVPATVTKLVDYLPDGLDFSSELNKSWTQTSNGELVNLSTSTTKIQPGESLELYLVATKNMTANETGTYTNKAEIVNMNSSTGVADKDSTPGNHAENEDDFSKADLIISISTGEVFASVLIIIFILAVIATIVFINKKYIGMRISKLSLFLLIFMTLIASQFSEVFAAYETTRFANVYDGYKQTNNFTGGPDGKGGTCVEHGVWAYTGNYKFYYAEQTSSSTTTGDVDVDFTLTKGNTNIEMKQSGSNYIYGPFKVNCSDSNATYTFSVLDNSGKEISGYNTSDASGNSMTVKGTSTFYITIPADKCTNGVSKVKLTLKKAGTKTTTTKYYGYIIYQSYGELYHNKDEAGKGTYPEYYSNGQYVNSWDTQEVRTKSILLYKTTTSSESVSSEKSIEWTDINGGLEIVKQDSDDENIKLSGVEIRVENSSTGYNQVFKTDENGKISISNLPKGTYKITEVSNDHYGYAKIEEGSTTIYTGAIQSFVLKNEKQTGNLKIQKRDYDDTGVGLEGVTFKIKNSKGEYIIAVDDNGNTQNKVVGSIHLGDMKTTTDENSATEFVTDESGNITISNILIDTYTVIETSIGDHYGYMLEDEYVFWEASTSGNGLTATVKVDREKSTDTDSGQSNNAQGTTLTVKNQKQTGNLKIEKRDYDDEKVPIVGVSFKIKNSKGEYIIALDDNGNKQSKVEGSIHLGGMETTTNEKEATEFVTDKNGNVAIYNILIDTYEVIEISVGDNYGYKLEDEYVFWQASTSGNGLTATIKVEREKSTDTNNVGNDNTPASSLKVANQKQTGNLKIFKKDSHNDNLILEGISFKIKNSKGEYIIALDDNKKSQTKVVGSIHLGGMETTTNENQATEFVTDKSGTIEIYNMWIDTYTVIETSVGDNFGYDLDDAFINWETDESNGNGLTATVVVERQKSYDTNADSIGNGKNDNLTVTNKRKYIKVSGYAWEDRVEGKNSTKDYLWNEGTEDKRLEHVVVRLKDARGNVLATKETDSNGEYIFGNYDEDANAIKIEIDDLVGGYVEFEYNGMSYQSIPLNLDKENGNKASEDKLRDDFNAKYAIISKGCSQDINGNKVYNIRYDTANHESKVHFGDSLLYGYEGQLYPINGVDTQYIIQAITEKRSNNILNTDYTADSIREQSIEEIENINLGVEQREMPDLAITEDMQKVEISLNDYTHTYLYEQRPQEDENPGKDNTERADGFNVTVKFSSKYMEGSYTREVYSSDVVYNKQPGNEGKLKILITYKIKLRNESTNLYNNLRGLVNYYDSRYENAVVTDENGKELNSRTTGETNGFKRLEIDTNQQLAPQKIKTIYITYQLSNDAVNSLLNEEPTLNSVSEISSYSTYSDEGYSKIYGAIDIDSAPDNATPDNTDTYEDDTDKAPSLILSVKEGRVVSGTVWEDSAIDSLLQNTGFDKERKGDGIYQNTENVIQNVKVELIAVENKEDAENLGVGATPAKLYKKDNTVVDASVNTDNKGQYSFVGVIPSQYVLRFTYGDNSVIYDPSGNNLGNIKADNYKSTIYRGGDKDAVNNMDDYWYREETSGDSVDRLSDAKDKIGIKQDDSVIEDIIADRTNEENEITYETTAGKGLLKDIIAQTRNFDIKLDYDVNLDNMSKDGEDLKFTFDNIDFGIIKRPEQSLSIDKQISNVKISLANGIVIVDGDPRTQNLTGVKLLDDDVYIELDNEIIQGANLRITYAITVDNKDCEIDYNDEDYYIYGKVPQNHENYAIATVKDMFDYLPEDLVLDSTDGNWERVEITPDMKDKLLAENVYEKVKNLTNIIHLKDDASSVFENMQPGAPAIDTSMVVTRQLSTTADDLTYENDIEVVKLKGRKTKDSIPGNYDPTTNTPDELDDDNVELTITGPTGGDRQYLLYGVIGIGVLAIIGLGVIIIKRKVLKN